MGSDAGTAGMAGTASKRRGRLPRVIILAALTVCALVVGVAGAALADALPGGQTAQVRVVDAAALPAQQSTQSQPTTQTTATPTACPCPGVKQTVPVPDGGMPKQKGQVILISERQQWLWAYDDGKLFLASPTTTGRPELPTPKGHFTIMSKEANTTFYSPWPVGSPWYYSPLHINYAMYFKSGGFYIHDAWWRYKFGPGSNVPHTVNGQSETGSHGCVNLPTDTMLTLYNWTRIGAAVIIE